MKTLRRDLLWILPAGLVLGLALSLLDGETWWIGWLAYGLVLILGLLALSVLWRSATANSARPLAVNLAWILAVTVSLRLVLGVALTFVLPAGGNGTDAELAGYLYKDAYHRDVQAWHLAHSGESLLQAFDKDYSSDQYGGMIGLSAVIYRLLCPDEHRPWLMILVGALTYAAGLALAWKAILKAWGGPDGGSASGPALAVAAGWVLALYPESVMLGASQMREPFLVGFVCMAFWGFLAVQHSNRSGWLWLAGSVVGLLFFSPALAVFALVTAGGWSWVMAPKRRVNLAAILLTAAVVLLGARLLQMAMARGTLLTGASWSRILEKWLNLSSASELYPVVQNSGPLQSIFSMLPEKYHVPFITLTGLIQPILPGTIVDATAWPWRVLNILRSAGWYALAPFLIFGLIAAWKAGPRKERLGWTWLWLMTAGWIVFCSLRAFGDQWDNPRYRVLALLFEALVAGLAWTYWRESRNPWMGRILAMEGVFVVLFTYWYIVRAIGWAPGQVHVFVVAGAIVVLSVLIVLGGWILDWRKSRRRT